MRKIPVELPVKLFRFLERYAKDMGITMGELTADAIKRDGYELFIAHKTIPGTGVEDEEDRYYIRSYRNHNAWYFVPTEHHEIAAELCKNPVKKEEEH